MNTPSFLHTLRSGLWGALLAVITGPAAGQIPNTLRHSIPPPGVGPQTGARLGSSVAVDGGLTVAGAPLDNTTDVYSGVVKVFDTTTGALLFTLPNPNPAIVSRFGASVALSGMLVAVGASYADSDTALQDSGIAYVFDLSSATPTAAVVTLRNPTPTDGDNFGSTVAICGNLVVVGASGDDTGTAYAGSAYVYDMGSAAPPVPVVTLHNPTPAEGDYYGSTVAISGTRVVVGASGDDTGATNTGSAYVYDMSSITPTVPVLTLRDPAPAADDYFGRMVAISGMRVVVGSAWRGVGRVYVYDLGSPAPAVPVVAMRRPSMESDSAFGSTVALSGARVVVGDLNGFWNVPPLPGSAYVYDLNSATPAVPVATFHTPDRTAKDGFGIAVGIQGTQVVVGAGYDDRRAEDAGSVYVYDLTSGTPAVPVAVLNDPGVSAGDWFGRDVAISGTLMVAGAPFEGEGTPEVGAAYVFDLASATPAVPVLTLRNHAQTAYYGIGWSVAISGTRVVVGAIGAYEEGVFYGGSAFVYDLSSGTPAVPVAILTNPGAAAGEDFGWSVAISGTRVVVGASGDDTGAENAGSAYVYDLSSATPLVPVAILRNPAPGSGEPFGASVAISGTWVVIGTHLGLSNGALTGSAYAYDLSSVAPTVPAVTFQNPGQGQDAFGKAVAISGRLVAVAGSRGAGPVYSGPICVYDLNSGTPAVPAFILNKPGPQTHYNGFSGAVAISGTRVVAGASGEDSEAGYLTGSAYLFDLQSSTPTVPVAILPNPAPRQYDRFGSAVDIDGATAVIATPFDGAVAFNKGAAYIYGPHPLDQDSDGLLDSWERIYWPTTAGHSAHDDFDHDGYNELLELALGLNPTVANPGGLPSVTVEGGYLMMTITKQPGVTYEVQSAGTLLPGMPDSFSAASTTMLINDATTLKVRDNFLIGAGPRRFLRLKVTAAP